MKPKYDFSILNDGDLDLECIVINPESVFGVTNGSLKWQKFGKEIVSGIVKIFSPKDRIQKEIL
jgi:hypothetical protein